MRSMASFATSLNALVWIAMPCSCLISHSARTLIAAVTALSRSRCFVVREIHLPPTLNRAIQTSLFA